MCTHIRDSVNAHVCETLVYLCLCMFVNEDGRELVHIHVCVSVFVWACLCVHMCSLGVVCVWAPLCVCVHLRLDPFVCVHLCM